MTEHSKFPPPEERKGAGDNDSSLLERASGAFGLGDFKPAPMPRDLADAPMKRARRIDRAPAAPVGAEPKVEPRPGAVASEPDAALPVPVAPPPPPPSVIEAEGPTARLGGDAHPIDRAHLREQGLIDPEGPVTALLEEFRIVKRQLLAAAKERGTAASRRILVTSPHPDEGKTFCTANLAIALAAERDVEVVLVDADFAKPSVLSTFGLPKGAGFMDALADPAAKVETFALRTDIGNLWVLPAGDTARGDSEYLASERTVEVLERLTIGAPNRIVLFDSPPALAASPAAELAKHVGQTVLIARADKTGRNALEDACQLLAACPDIKLLLNAARFSPSGRRFGAYYG